MVAKPSMVGGEVRDDLAARDRLLRAAVRAFSTSGYDGMSVREIERQAGVNRGIAAYHFGSKDRLWRDCVDWLMAGCHAEMQRYSDMLGVVSGPERRRVLLTAFVEFVARHPEFFRIVVIEGSEPSERTTWVADRLRGALRFFDGLSGRPGGSASDDAMSAYMFLGAASLPFAVPEQCRYLFGFEPDAPDFLTRFTRTVAGLRLFEGPGDATEPA